MAYREDLEAAQIRIAELEGQLAEQGRELNLRWRRREESHTKRWIWVGAATLATIALAGAVVFELARSQERGHRRSEALQGELHEAQAELVEAREDSRMAFEMISQSVEAEKRRDPSDELEHTVALDEEPWRQTPGHLFVISDRPARIVVDGTHLHEWTPRRLNLSAGQHAITLVSEDHASHHTVRIVDGQDQQLTVRFGQR